MTTLCAYIDIEATFRNNKLGIPAITLKHLTISII
jgi:hypothetical protein